MRTIHKYLLAETIEMPAGASVLTVQMQNDQPYIWAEVDTDRPMETRHFEIVGTGHAISSLSIDYVGTVQAGPLVWHIYQSVTCG